MKFRDILAVPFWFLGVWLEKIAAVVGSVWTANTQLEAYKRACREMKESKML